MEKDKLIGIDKYMSLLLRHRPEREHLDIDRYGYVSTDLLIKKLNITKEELDWIVENNNKKRFSYNNDKTLIRANQGHSFTVELELELINNYDSKLYHGTSMKNWGLIDVNGLRKMKRQYVHLSPDYDTAKTVGLRHAKKIEYLMMIEFDAKQYLLDGNKIYKSKNNVYLVDNIERKYLKLINVYDHLTCGGAY